MLTKLTLIPVAKAFSAAVDRLRELPQEPDQIAAIMTEFGITGHCSDPAECVLARYAEDAFDADTAAELDLEIHSGDLTVQFGDFCLVWEIPFHLETFMRKFDKGHYPQLVAQSEVV